MTQVFVVAPARSGASLVAGMLHDLGVPMSLDGEWAPARAGYMHQTWEDGALWKLNRTRMTEAERRAASEAYVLARMEAHGATWGAKDVALPEMAQWLLPYAPNARLMVVWREPAAVMASYMAAHLADRNAAERWLFGQRAAIDKLLKAFPDVPVLQVTFDDLVERPEEVLGRLGKIVGGEGGNWTDGKGLTDVASAGEAMGSGIGGDGEGRRRATGTVHFDETGRWRGGLNERQRGEWGRVAVGARIGKYAEPEFDRCYQNLLLRGMRPGDVVLETVAHAPAHWAADRLARDFLRSGADSLLMLDDDMTFDADALERLRSVPAGMEFDGLMGFCTKRAWPPRPITMRALRYQPPAPLSLAGTYYQHFMDYGDAEVLEVDMVGLAFTLFRRHVLEEMIGEWGPMWTQFFPYVAHQSDDAAFCQQARGMGMRLGVALDVAIGHLGKVAYGKREFDQWMGQMRKVVG